MCLLLKNDDFIGLYVGVNCFSNEGIKINGEPWIFLYPISVVLLELSKKVCGKVN